MEVNLILIVHTMEMEVTYSIDLISLEIDLLTLMEIYYLFIIIKVKLIYKYLEDCIVKSKNGISMHKRKR